MNDITGDIKNYIENISEEDIGKYVIQDNELRYKESEVTNQEEKWLEALGISAAVTLYTIIFLGKDGTEYKKQVADKIVFPNVNPVSNNEYFAGWYSDATYATRVEEGTPIESDVTLYSKWDKVITVEYKVDGIKYATIRGETLKFPTNNPTKANVNFAGWYYEDGTMAEEGTTLDASYVLVAKWNSYITNKLNGTVIFGDFYYSGYGDGQWHYVTNSSELSSFKPSDAQYTPDSYPAIVKYGNTDFSIPKGEVLYTYKGSTEIEKTEITYFKTVGGTEMSTFIEGNSNGQIINTNGTSSLYTYLVKVKVTFKDGSTDTDEFKLFQHITCLVEGTKITLADRTTKNIEDITYEDDLLVWDFDRGTFATAKPLWIKKAQSHNEYNYIKFDDGTVLKTVIDHRIFNMESQKFTYTMNEEDTPLGTTTFKDDGTTAKIVERKVVKEDINFYNIITDYHMNIFAEGILTSLRLNNLYEIKDMKFIKDNRTLRTRQDYATIPDKYFYGLRLAEQSTQINKKNDAKHTNTLTEYVENIMQLEK